MEAVEILAIKPVKKKGIDLSLKLTRRDRKRMEKVYLVALLFVAIGLSQMAIARITKFDLRGTVPMPSFMWLVTGLVCIILMVYTELHDTFPVNWTLGFVTVESMTFCVICYDWTSTSSWLASVVVLATLVLNVIVYGMAASCPLRCIPTYRVMMIATIVYTVVYILIVIVVFSVHKGYLVLVEGWTFLYVTLLSFYSASLVHNRHLDVYRSDEYMLSATLISSMFLYMIHLVLAILGYSLALHARYTKEHY